MIKKFNHTFECDKASVATLKETNCVEVMLYGLTYREVMGLVSDAFSEQITTGQQLMDDVGVEHFQTRPPLKVTNNCNMCKWGRPGEGGNKYSCAKHFYEFRTEAAFIESYCIDWEARGV